MCAWHLSVSLAHFSIIIAPNAYTDPKGEVIHIYGVLDGHGGGAIADFVVANYAKCILKPEKFEDVRHARSYTRTYHHVCASLHNQDCQHERRRDQGRHFRRLSQDGRSCNQESEKRQRLEVESH